jgi:phospholipase C
MTVVSPWSRGGWVNSEVFDHTSVIRFLETWTGVREPNISRWRREICGDLTSCFDFEHRDLSLPVLPDTAALRRQADLLDRQLPTPEPPPEGRQVWPEQEPGTAPARPLPYQPLANFAGGVTLANAGVATVPFAVYSGDAVQQFDLRPGGSKHVPVAVGAYDLWVHGPNGFLRHFADGGRSGAIEATLTLTGSGKHPKIHLRLENSGGDEVIVEITDALRPADSRRCRLGPSGSVMILDPLSQTHGWYDLTVSVPDRAGFVRRFAGRVENGRPGVTG